MGNYIMKKNNSYQYLRNKFVVHINYYSGYSSGQMIINGLFFIEKYRKLKRLFRDCAVRQILIKDVYDEISIVDLPNMETAYKWLLEKESQNE